MAGAGGAVAERQHLITTAEEKRDGGGLWVNGQPWFEIVKLILKHGATLTHTSPVCVAVFILIL